MDAMVIRVGYIDVAAYINADSHGRCKLPVSCSIAPPLREVVPAVIELLDPVVCGIDDIKIAVTIVGDA